MKTIFFLMGAGILASGCTNAAKPSAKAGAKPVAAPAKIVLAQNGKTAYVIAVASDAIPAEQTAALQLQDYLQQVTGATLAVKPESAVGQGAPQILVGAGPRVKKLLPQQNWKALGSDGIVIKTVGNKLVLAGGRPRGSLYAVFQFLEDSAGCRWWAPDAKTIPTKKTLAIAPQNLTYVSPFSYREHYATAPMEDADFATILRENGHHQKQDAAWGGHYNMLGFVHTFSALLPQETYFKAHPEWYSDPNNGNKPCTAASAMPVGQNTQLCLSNPEVLDELTAQALKWIAKDPGAGYISISQNDGDNYCACPECSKLVEREGSQSGPVLNFVNQVAARIGQKYPDFWVETLAYRGSVVPPKTIRPVKNVLIRLAPIAADFGHELNSDWNKTTRDNVLQWAKIAPHLFIWNYVTNFNTTLMPHPNWDGLAKDLRFFAANNVRGVFEQGNAYTNSVGDFAPLRVWLIGKLMWNPKLDQDKLINEFLKGYYGAAAPHLGAYRALVQKSFTDKKFGINLSNRDFSFLGLNEMNQATRLFEQAEAAVRNGKVLSERLRREKLSLDIAWIMRYRPLRLEAGQPGREFLGPKDGQAALEQFFKTTAEMGVKFWGEHVTVESQRTILEGRLAPAVPLPEFAAKLPADDVIDIQDRAFSLHGHNIAQFEDDPAASDGKAASSLAAGPDWAIQAELNQALSGLEPEKWRVYAMVRVQLKPGAERQGAGITAGIYDDTNMKRLGQKGFNLHDLGVENYKLIDLGVYLLNRFGYIWFASQQNPGVEKIFVDRIILIKDHSN